jgi:integral membrane protein
MRTAIGRLRVIGLLEGTSFLILLGIAMPLKYLLGLPLAVKLVGWVHGLLFVLFCVVLALAARSARWPLLRVGGVFVAALLPFGPFLIDGRLKREDLDQRAA